MAVLAPKCIGDIKNLDNELSKTTAAFWKHVWNNPKHIIPKKYKYLMAFCAAISSDRLGQAARELTKAYGEGASVAEITEAMEIMIWNMGIPYFACDFNTSPAMEVFNKIKLDSQQEIPVQETISYLKTQIIHKLK